MTQKAKTRFLVSISGSAINSENDRVRPSATSTKYFREHHIVISDPLSFLAL